MRSKIGRRLFTAAATALLAFMSTSNGARADDCKVWSTGLTFAPYSFTQTAADKAVGTISFNCIGEKAGVEIDVDLTSGNSENLLDRYMSNASSRLHYNVFLNGDLSETFGNGQQGVRYSHYYPITTAAVTKYGQNVGSSLTILGVIWPRQNVAAGSYTDSLIATVTVDH